MTFVGDFRYSHRITLRKSKGVRGQGMQEYFCKAYK